MTTPEPSGVPRRALAPSGDNIRVDCVRIGRYARVFIGLTPGWSAEDGAMPSVEEVAGHMA